MGTLEGGYQRMIDALADRIRSLGGTIETGMTVSDIEPADGGGATLRAGGESRRFDLVFSTLLPEQGRRLLGTEYAAAAPADHCRYLGVLCLIVRTRESVSPYYTLSLTDRSVGLTTVVETTHVTDPASVGGHLLYVTKYVDPSNALLTADAADVERGFLAEARRILPDLDEATILGTTLQRARAVEPVHLVGGAQPAALDVPGAWPGHGLERARVPRGRQRPGGARRGREGRRGHPLPRRRVRPARARPAAGGHVTSAVATPHQVRTRSRAIALHADLVAGGAAALFALVAARRRPGAPGAT